ncbi:hypothetical protein, partial [Escherichia coli]|uniref:hypothetical protein n=1 Tax=Escherichia coli TaxID=562 RepID=UPI0030C69B84
PLFSQEFQDLPDGAETTLTLKPPFTPDHAARTGTAVACVSSGAKEHILCTQNPFSLLMATDV